jgi:hypothetical protein
VTSIDVIDNLFSGQQRRPPLTFPTTAPISLTNLFRRAIDANVDKRLTLRALKSATMSEMKINNINTKGTVVDHMVLMMNRYAHDLERLVGERTAALVDAQRRADHLLNQMMPPSVAALLKAGHDVPPKLYSSATVLFTDIVGFTSLSAQSTPMNVVTLLNELFTKFDAIVTKYDAYKVIVNLFIILKQINHEYNL